MAIYLVSSGVARQVDDGFEDMLEERLSSYGVDWLLVEALSRASALDAGRAYDSDETTGDRDALVLDSAGASAKLATLGIKVRS